VNELSVLMHLLSNKKSLCQIGATKKEIFQTLNIKDKNKNIHFQDLLINLSKYLEPLGLQVRFNPIDSRWFISYDLELSGALSVNPFNDKPKLAATLFTCLVSCLQNNGIGELSEIKTLRNKKDLITDLKELEEMGFIQINKDQGFVRLTPLIGYQLDLEHLFVKLALKQKDTED